MTDVARLWRCPTPRASRSPWHFRRTLAVVAALGVSTTAVVVVSPVSASISSDRARAAQLYTRMQTVAGKVDYLGQKFDAAQLQVTSEQNLIFHTREIVAQDASQVSLDQNVLRTVAIENFVNAGAQAAQNPLFSGNESDAGAASVYSELAEGNLNQAVADLKNNSIELTQQRHILHAQVRVREQAAREAQASLRRAQVLEGQLASMEHNVSAQIGAYIRQAAAAQAAANAAEWARTHPGEAPYAGSYSNFPVPPPDSRADIAVRTALSYLGVPYVWGGASRSGVDCSGLVMLAWDAAGVYLPHYSGAQYEDTVHIPLADAEPGDLLFYGYDGDQHVAMYIGRGLMIEAPEAGQVVHITPIRTGYDFAGVGRVR